MSISFLNRLAATIFGKLRLRTLLFIPLLLQVFTVVGLLGYLSQKELQVLWLCISASILAATVSILIWGWLVQPIELLNRKVGALSRGKWEPIPELKRSDALGELVNSLNRVAAQLQELKQENTDLKIVLETSTEHGDTVADRLYDQVEEAMCQSERRLAQFLEAVPVGVSVLDQFGKLYFMNQAAKQIFGKGIEPDVTSEQLSEVYQVYIAGTERLYPPEELPIARSLKGESVTADDLEIRRGDRRIPIEVWTTPIYDEQGNILYGINALQDITQRKQADKLVAEYSQTLEKQVRDRTQELSQTLERLQSTQQQLVESEKMAALGSLVAGVAHEINTPIGTAILTASFLSKETQSLLAAWAEGNLKRSVLKGYLDIAKESSELILRNLERAGELVQSFKQVSVDCTSLEKRPFAVKNYLEEALFNLNPQLKQTKHRLTIVGDETLIIDSYPGALSQVVTNLVLNSITHAYQPDEGGNLRFQVMGDRDRAIVQYTDDGCGIPAQNLGKIFEPFFTTARSQGGSGLGLHIVYNLVTQKLQGTIRCESQLGVGTTFIINLPLVIRNQSEV
ncbi:MAG TPA: hypothetical protein DDZ80_15715 [Cyanobacteria bacterium UBA8803]|nr:hypothetical protein [Cyanobacteria bacterium UBA9273]HBL59864.1 hypothetical protein [Cyanobacteria bacterium UBA8803]